MLNRLSPPGAPSGAESWRQSGSGRGRCVHRPGAVGLGCSQDGPPEVRLTAGSWGRAEAAGDWVGGTRHDGESMGGSEVQGGSQGESARPLSARCVWGRVGPSRVGHLGCKTGFEGPSSFPPRDPTPGGLSLCPPPPPSRRLRLGQLGRPVPRLVAGGPLAWWREPACPWLGTSGTALRAALAREAVAGGCGARPVSRLVSRLTALGSGPLPFGKARLGGLRPRSALRTTRSRPSKWRSLSSAAEGPPVPTPTPTPTAPARCAGGRVAAEGGACPPGAASGPASRLVCAAAFCIWVSGPGSALVTRPCPGGIVPLDTHGEQEAGPAPPKRPSL